VIRCIRPEVNVLPEKANMAEGVAIGEIGDGMVVVVVVMQL
jgi:hypothetical protein